MPAIPSIDKRLVGIPFAKGLSQREDARWLAPGSLLTANNAVHPKTNVVAKRPGSLLLERAGVIPTNAGSGSESVSLVTGRRLFTYLGILAIVGADAWTDAVWTYDDNAFNISGTPGRPLLMDRVPETTISPPDVISSGAANESNTATGRVVQIDTVVANGYELHVWGIGDVTGGGGADIWYSVRNASTGAAVVSGQKLLSLGIHSGIDVPKLTLVGTTAVLTYSSNASTDGNIYARVLQLADFPFVSWSTETRANLNVGDAAYATGIWSTAAYDVAVSTGEANVMALIYEANLPTFGNSLVLVRLAVLGTGVSVLSSVILADSQWNTDSKPVVQGFALRTDFTTGEAAFTYSWVSATPTCRVSFGILAWPAFSTIAITQNLLTSGAFNAAIVLDLERIGTIGALVQCYKVAFSPGQTTWRNGDAASVWPFIMTFVVSNVGGVATVAAHQPRVTWNVTLASRILPLNGIGYMVGYVPSDVQGSFFLFAEDAWGDVATPNQTSGFARGDFPLRLVGNLGPRQANVQTFTSGTMGLGTVQFSRVATHIPLNPNASGGLVYQTVIPRDTSPITSAPARYQVDFASPRAYPWAQLGGNVFIGGGCPSCFDGGQVFELGFPVFPILNLDVQSSGGGVAGTYSYCAVYQWTDRAGQVHTSARAVPSQVTLTTGQSVIAVVGIPGFSARMKAINASTATAGAGVGPQAQLPQRPSVRVILYRTQAGESVYHQVAPTAAVQLDSESVSLTDAWVADVDLAAQPLLYGDGSLNGTLDDECPPAWQHVVAHQNRVFGIDGNRLWSTKAFTTGEGSGVNELTVVTVDDGPNDLTALASMDGNLILFKRDRILYMSGQGPGDDGGSNDWSPPTRITADMGCVDWRSVVVTPQGCWFLSDAGLRLLSRDLQVMQETHVEDAIAANPFITSAVIHPNRNRVLWTANVDDVSVPRTGIGLDHDYVLDSWLTSSASDGASVQGAVSGVVSSVPTTAFGLPDVEPTYHWLQADGTVHRESPSGYLDGAVYAPTTIETAWIKGDGLEAFARFRRLMVTWQNNDPHQLAVFVAYDYGPTYYLMGTITAAQMLAMATPLCQVSFQLPRQRAESVRFKLVDAPDGVMAPVTGQGPTLISLGLEYAAYTNKRLARVPTAQRR